MRILTGSKRPLMTCVAVAAVTGLSCNRLSILRAEPPVTTAFALSGDVEVIDKETAADDTEVIDEIGDFYKSLFFTDYSRRLSDLEPYKTGDVNDTRVPYADFHYPEGTGGTNVRTPGSPDRRGSLDKWDAAFHNGVATAADWEKRYHSEDVSWYGHCNGFSTAASRHRDPQRSVMRPVGCDPNTSCVEFTPTDIRALLAEIYMSAVAKFLSGQRCEIENAKLEPRDRTLRPNQLVMDACEDANPGSFHVGLVNWIGIQKQVLVYDYNRDIQVWNFPISRYEIRSQVPISREAAAQAIRGNRGGEVQFNPQAASFVQVQMTVYYTQNLGEVQVGGRTVQQHKGYRQPSTYNYVLELDADGIIIGGEWIGTSIAKHPDFIWIPFEPIVPQDKNDRRFGNPYVDPKEVIAMWAESVGLNPADPFNDPNNPNKILMYPAVDWGKHKDFAITLDGTDQGAVFLGKKVKLNIKRKAPLQGDVVLELALNEKVIARLNLTGANDVEYEFDSPPGINRLGFVWRRSDGTPLDSTYGFQYYAMR